MVDIYKDWNVFVSNMDIVPEQLDGEKLIAMASELSRSREEREMLGKEAVNGDKVALESLINSYVRLRHQGRQWHLNWETKKDFDGWEPMRFPQMNC